MRTRLKWLFFKATLYSLWIEGFVIFNSSYLLRKAINNKEETILQSPQQKSIVRDVSHVMRVIGRRAPWDPMCLNLSYVAKNILRAYQIESTFRLGYLNGRPKDKMEGHAWITINGILVTGWLPNLKDYVEMTYPKQKDLTDLKFDVTPNMNK